MNYYDILEISKDAPIDDIKKQYKKLALKHHPDRGGDPEMFKKISEAYQTLSDPEKKRDYDNPNPFSQRMSSTHHFNPQHTHFVDPNIIFQQFFNNNNFSSVNGLRNIRTNITHKSISIKMNGNTKIETITEVKNGVKTQTVKQTNMKTGMTSTNVKRISS